MFPESNRSSVHVARPGARFLDRWTPKQFLGDEFDASHDAAWSNRPDVTSSCKLAVDTPRKSNVPTTDR